ncbi:MAG: zf-HC2 domain-containing protein [candidate division Zixibacteria bacterium]
MNCKEFLENIDTYLEDDLEPALREGFEQHIASCDSCQSELMSYDKCAQIFRKLMSDEDPPDSLRKAVFEKCGCKNMPSCCPPPKQNK